MALEGRPSVGAARRLEGRRRRAALFTGEQEGGVVLKRPCPGSSNRAGAALGLQRAGEGDDL